jgi:hypothetical protein
MRAIGLVAMFHVEPSRAGRDGRLPAKRSVYNLESAPESCRWTLRQFAFPRLWFIESVFFHTRGLATQVERN